uniref:uracil-DNA glycosylase family protein n=1 Tax=Ancylobacter lacus TaxID=2579970 RepID=UPI003CCE873E
MSAEHERTSRTDEQEAAAQPQSRTLAGLRAEARACRARPLWAPATQTVFGEGPERASLLFVGEQPGDQEDLAGRPFIGPAGLLFDRALAKPARSGAGVRHKCGEALQIRPPWQAASASKADNR